MTPLFILFFLTTCDTLPFDIIDSNPPDLGPSISLDVTTLSFWKQFRVCHPPFPWRLPLGLTNETLPLFWSQPENKRHFFDTNSSNHCGVVRVISNGKIHQPYPSVSNETHFINTHEPAVRTNHPEYEFLLVLTGHWGYYFQHFFDNLGPHIAIALESLGVDHRKLTVLVEIEPDLFPNVPKLWDRIGFKKVVTSVWDRNYSAKVLVMIESCPRVHPDFFTKLRELFNLPIRRRTKIVWILRKSENSYYQQRLLSNQDSVINALKKEYGEENFVAFDHRYYNMNETIELFASAKVIMGTHGGGLYNQFFAQKSCIVVEIMPVRKNGLYPDQKNATDVPSFSHMAVWSNSLLIGQEFWRYYAVANGTGFTINIESFIAFLREIPRLRNKSHSSGIGLK